MTVQNDTGWRGAGDRGAAILAVVANALWLPQAFLLAGALSDVVLATGDFLPELAGFAALGLLRALLDHLATARAALSASRFKAGIRRRIAAEAARWSPVDIRRPPPGEIAALAAEGVEAVDPYLTRYGTTRARVTVVPLLILLAIAATHWLPGLLLLVAGPLIPVFMALIGANAREASERQLTEIGGLSGALLDRLNGLETIRLHDAVDATATSLAARAESIRRRTMAVLRIAFLSSAVLELVAMVGVGGIAIFVGFTFLGWISLAPELTLAGGLFILLLAPEFFQPLRDFGAAYHDRAAAEALFARLETLFPGTRSRLPGAGIDRPSARTGPAAVTLEDIRFAYPGAERPVLDGFSLAIAAGERVAVMGPSGAGKSTLLALLSALALPDGGRVLVDGTPVSDATADSLRSEVALLPQQAALFHGSVRRNVTLGRPTDAADVAAALGLARAHFVDRLPRGDLTRLGEDGVGLSGGEARRIALARMSLGPARVILADEPTAHLDAETADAVADALLALGEGRTLIVATHDARLARRMDRTIALGLRETADA